MSPTKPQIVFRLSPELLGWVRNKAKERKITVSDFIVELLEKELKESGDIIDYPEEGEDQEPITTINKILEMDAEGKSFTRIAMELNKKEILTRRKSEWYAETVGRIVKKYKKQKRSHKEKE